MMSIVQFICSGCRVSWGAWRFCPASGSFSWRRWGSGLPSWGCSCVWSLWVLWLSLSLFSVRRPGRFGGRGGARSSGRGVRFWRRSARSSCGRLSCARLSRFRLRGAWRSVVGGFGGPVRGLRPRRGCLPVPAARRFRVLALPAWPSAFLVPLGLLLWPGLRLLGFPGAGRGVGRARLRFFALPARGPVWRLPPLVGRLGSWPCFSAGPVGWLVARPPRRRAVVALFVIGRVPGRLRVGRPGR